MCSTPTPYLKEEVLPPQAEELSINMPVRRAKKYNGRPKKSIFSKRCRGQRLRRLREKQKELATQNVSDTKDVKNVLQEVVNDPLHILSQDTNTIQDISSPVQASNIATDCQCNSTEKADISQSVCNSNTTQNPNLKTIPKETTTHGRRIIDVDYFFNMLKFMNQHSKSGCNLNDIIITNEKMNGLSTAYCLKCTMCDFEDIIWSECPTKQRNINTDTIAGMLSVDCNFLIMNKLLSKMGLPLLTRTVFVNECQKILSDEEKKGLSDPNSNFPIIEYSNKLGKSSEPRFQAAACQTSISPKKSYEKNSKELQKNLVLKHEPATDQATVCDSLDKSKNCEECYLNKLLVEDKFENCKQCYLNKVLVEDKFENCEQCYLNNLLVEDKFEIEDRSDTRYEDESENMLYEVLDLRTSKAKDNLVIGQRQVSLNMTRTKNETSSDI